MIAAEPITLDDCYAPMHQNSRGEPAAQLRRLARWIEEHGLELDELVSAEVSAHDLKLHIEEAAARRLFPGREVLVDHDGHAHFRDEGILFVFISGKERGPKAVTL